MSFDADTIYRQINEAGEDWADKKAAYETLDDLSKTVYADILSDYLPPTCSTKAEAETRTYASAKWKEHLAAVSGARRAWLLSEVRYKNLQTLAELRRSQESTRRAEMGMR